MSNEDADQLLTPAEVARLFRVDPKTVTRWANDGKIASIRTLGGHRRFHESEIRRLLHEGESATGDSATGDSATGDSTTGDSTTGDSDGADTGASGDDTASNDDQHDDPQHNDLGHNDLGH